MTPKLTAAHIVSAIAQLDRAVEYSYVGRKAKLLINDVVLPEGPVEFLRQSKSGGLTAAKITKQSIATLAAICSQRPNYPLHIDRIFSAGGNTRSAFETLLAHTAHFFICYPRRTDAYSGKVKTDLKHILWSPERTHPPGIVEVIDYDGTITEIELGVEFDRILLTATDLGEEFNSIEAKRTHVQMQVALIEIGRALGFKIWIAQNDQGIRVGNKRLGEYEGVLTSLDTVDILYTRAAKRAAQHIDCLWFSADGKHIPAVMEIEHSTGVTSGLTRMTKLKDEIPAIRTSYTVVASQKLRSKIVAEANKALFRDLNVTYMSYTTVQNLFGLIRTYALSGYVDHRFIQPFLEKVVSA
ncbi:MAG: restriction endonuclease [bacterium]|nr:restriction endonuclease [bacterium]